MFGGLCCSSTGYGRRWFRGLATQTGLLVLMGSEDKYIHWKHRWTLMETLSGPWKESGLPLC